MSLTTLLLPLCLLAAAPDDDPSCDDLARLQGRWESALDERGVRFLTLDIRDKRVAAGFRFPDAPMPLVVTGTLKLDESGGVKTMDWVKLKTSQDASVPDFLAIYKFEGDDLVLCGGKKRPEEFGGKETLRLKKRK